MNASRNIVAIVLNIMFSTIGLIINILINMFLTPVITKKIGVEAYGFIALSNNIVGYIEIIAVAINSLASRYIAIEYHKNDFKEANKIYNSVLISNIILSIIILISSIFIINNLQDYINIPINIIHDIKVLFYLVTINYILMLLSTCFNVATFIKNRLDLNSKVKTSSYILKGVLLYVIFSFCSPHVWQVMTATIVSTLLIFISNIYFTNKLTPHLNIDFKQFSIKIVLEIISNGIWNSISSIGVMLNSGLDLLVTNLYLSAKSMGQLSISKNFASIFNLFVVVFSQAFRPVQLKAYSEGDINKLVKELITSIKVTGCICAIIFAGVFSVGYDFFSLWIPGENIQLIYKITILILVGDVIGAITYPLNYVFIIVGKLKIPSLINIMNGIINIISMIILLKYTQLELYAVVITTTILNILTQVIIIPYIVCKYLSIEVKVFYPTIILNIMNCIFLSILFKAIISLFGEITSWVKLGIIGVILTLLGTILSIFVLFNKIEIRNVIITIMNRGKVNEIN